MSEANDQTQMRAIEIFVCHFFFYLSLPMIEQGYVLMSLSILYPRCLYIILVIIIIQIG